MNRVERWESPFVDEHRADRAKTCPSLRRHFYVPNLPTYTWPRCLYTHTHTHTHTHRPCQHYCSIDLIVFGMKSQQMGEGPHPLGRSGLARSSVNATAMMIISVIELLTSHMVKSDWCLGLLKCIWLLLGSCLNCMHNASLFVFWLLWWMDGWMDL